MAYKVKNIALTHYIIVLTCRPRLSLFYNINENEGIYIYNIKYTIYSNS